MDGETVTETAEFRYGSGRGESTQPRAERYGRRLEANHAAVEIGKVIGWQGNNGAEADTRARQPMPTPTLHHRTLSVAVLGPEILFSHRLRGYEVKKLRSPVCYRQDNEFFSPHAYATNGK